MPRVLKSLRHIALALSWLMLCLNTSHAQIMPTAQFFNGVTKTSKDTKPDSKLTSPTGAQLRTMAELDTQQSDMQSRLDTTKSELLKAQNSLKNVPLAELATRTVLDERTQYLQAQVDGYSQIVDALKDLRRISNNVVQAQQDKDNWQPPSGAMPWRLTTADDVQLAILQAQYQTEHLDQRLSILDDEILALKKTRAQIEIDLRQASNKTEPATSSQVIPASRSAEIIQRRLDLNNNQITLIVIDKDTVMTERQIAAIRLATLKKTWAYYDNQFVFSDEDLRDTLADLDKQVVSLRSKELTASNKINRTLDQAAAAKTQLERLNELPATSAEALTQAKNTLRMADVQAEAARMDREKYRALIELVAIQSQLWKIRHDIFTPNQTEENFTTAKTQQVNLVRRLDQGQQYLTQMIGEKSQSSITINEQLKAAQTPAEKTFLTSLIKPINEQIDNARSVYAEIGRVKQLLLITSEEINSKESNRSIGQKLDALQSIVWIGAKTAWNYEIFAVDDSILVDGREVRIKRSITVGKSIGALAILIIGFMLITGLIKRTLALAVNKANLGASKSIVIGRWLTLLAGVTLIISAFNLVEIPLSAFAFFGGALAIGVGFGTQNLLKNLISGVMLLIEKPIRIGDLVEIEGTTGVVTSIGIRFSTIHGAQGTDTLIPNSVLVEQKLVNWTYSTPDIRKELVVTVDATSDTQQVCELLMKVTLEHTSVMRTPGPLVTLEDFGENGLVFKLQCWMKIEPGLNPNQVLSDLRLNLLKSFKQVGIKLPFPQRTVQFDQNNPIHVQLNQTENNPGSQPTLIG